MSRSPDTHADELEYAALQRLRERADPAERRFIDMLVDRNDALEKRALSAEQECERLLHEVEAARKSAEESVIRKRRHSWKRYRRRSSSRSLPDAAPSSAAAGRTICSVCREGRNLSLSAPGEERPAHFRAMEDGVEIPPEDLPMQKAAATGQSVR